MYIKLYIVSICIICLNCASIVVLNSDKPTTNKNENMTTGTIQYKILKKPHHLFIGRCDPDDVILHQENIILNNDGKSQIAAAIKVNVEAKVSITCVKIFDEVPDGAGGYASYVSGGVGYNYVEFNVATDFGKGFHFFVQLYGNEL